MLENGKKITVHFINHWMHKTPTEEATGATGRIFTVKTQDGKMGFDGDISHGDQFTPFSSYAWSVIFKDISTNQLYRFSAIKNALEEVTDSKDGYIDCISWIS